MTIDHTDEDVLERRILEPDPGLVKSLGVHHKLESAVADLIDNSIDAGATAVRVRFEIERDGRTGLLVVDNGCGISAEEADEAMRLGRQRDYQSDAQGHFGIGLKAASLSQAEILTLWSTPDSREYNGRRLRKSSVQADFGCDVLDPRSFVARLNDHLALLGAATGTVVSWSDTTFPRGRESIAEWLDNAKSKLRMHLGLLYHRLLADERLSITIDIFDCESACAGAPENVVSIDPFGFQATKTPGYPKSLRAKCDEATFDIHCYILPPKSSGPQFRLYGRDGGDFQGFFVYRNDRLLQAGGWNNIAVPSRDRALCRVAIDDFASLAPIVRMNPEKTGLVFSHELSAAIASATSREKDPAERTTFNDYLAHAERVAVDSRRRNRARKPIAEPSKGIHEDVRRTIRSEVPLRTSEGPVEVRWRTLHMDRFLELDRENRVIYLNQRYREMLTGGKTGLSDAPLLKTLVFLLTEKHFTGQFWGSRDKDLLEMWDSILGAAVRTEKEYRSGGRRP